jgi:hypothetical protein
VERHYFLSNNLSLLAFQNNKTKLSPHSLAENKHLKPQEYFNHFDKPGTHSNLFTELLQVKTPEKCYLTAAC